MLSVAMDSRSMITRAQYMKGVKGTNCKTNDEEEQATINFNSKYGFVFTPPSKLDTNSNGNGLAKRTRCREDETSKEFTEKANLHENPIGERPLDKFRRAGMKARIVRRVGKFVEDRLTVQQIFNRYVKASTLHGFRFIFTKTFYVRRFIWLILTLVMAISFLKELTDSIKLYYKYPFSTTTTTEYVDVIRFPAVSICNLNKFKASKLNATKLARLGNNASMPMDRMWQDPGFEIPGEELKTIMQMSSHQIEDMLLKCTWIARDTSEGRENPCSARNFSVYQNVYGQYCFTMNSGKRNHSLLLLNETGLNHALELHLNLSTPDYLPGTQESGLRVILHEQDESPLLSTGFVVSPGFNTYVKLNALKVVNLPPPFATKCGRRNLLYFGKYQRTNCFEEELIKLVLSKCKCRGVFMPVTSDPICTLRQTHMCVYPTVASFSPKSARSCPIDCQSVEYQSELSYARFMSAPPIGSFAKYYLYRMQQESGMTNQQLAEHYRDNVVVLTIFYQELKLNKLVQETTYDFWKLIGDVGGQLGLMLGASVLTLVEFIDLIGFMIYHQLLRLSRRNKQRKKKEQQESLT